jgi:SAM-dependent methyltransferase
VSTAGEEANAQQRAYWNEISGPKWVTLADTVNEQIEPLGLAAMDAANLEPGQRVLDVGCGCGQTSLELASRVGATGSVLGLDISAPMLADARARASRASARNLEFIEGDAQVHALEPSAFDRVFSRFGVMFFADPVAAFANLASAVNEGGSLCFICWQAMPSNPWMVVPAQAAAQHIEMPAPADPGGPGPFSFADADHVTSVVANAGWKNVQCTDHSGELSVGLGQSLPDIIEFLQQMGPAGNALREATPEQRAKVTATMSDVLAPYYTDDALRMGFATWIVTATRAE